mmetsp:Transcript_14158/g.19524  ORF Transcript_14158/g.19524 Transcript_14158/m.19524 type:complete len:83 (-) Transcript_14158:279-527(-)|eukprot:CAMPEP_0194561256 /NCGR_PEP_ID=MMETSP0292-20121207/2115_1 /TAXON_ID=39354 /ORGANISM="Heterosigma akashiwo, Strain CCMP2393" /LENGTH=82 /DNA_ID=CAMNT_0039409611 /DNA_START=33 /DNA_END=281 /DNA_ORIENTATION=+
MNSPKDSLTREDHQNALEVVYEISSILNTGLDRDSLNILVNLCESGVNPEALAAVVQELRSEARKQELRQRQRGEQHHAGNN